ncbi:hypothetical protein ACFLTW_04165 [Chloroflexota bacterium]
MKLWQIIVAVALISSMPFFSGCLDNKAAEQEAYRQTLIEVQKQRDEYQRQTDAYNKAVAEGLQEYYSDLAEYNQKVAEQQAALAQQALERNQEIAEAIEAGITN